MKNLFIYLFIGVLILLNLFLVNKVRSFKNEPVIQDTGAEVALDLNRYYHKQNISGAQLNNGIKIDTGILVKDINNASVSLRSLIGKGTKLIIRNNEDGCGLCIEHELTLIKKFEEKIGKENIILVTTHNNVRKLKVFKEKNNINLDVYVCPTLELPYEKISKKPFLFLMDSSFVTSNFFIPELSESTISETYYSNIIDRYFTEKQ